MQSSRSFKPHKKYSATSEYSQLN